jgi:hypothetical protein
MITKLAITGIGSLLTCTAHAGVMTPGRWEVTTTVVSASGPSANKAALKQPMTVRACLSQAFADKENYTNPEFSMQRLTRMQFDCSVNSKSGDARKAAWAFSCTRNDGFMVSNKAESSIYADRFEQASTETTSKNNALWSEVSVKVAGKFLGQECKENDIPLSQ